MKRTTNVDAVAPAYETRIEAIMAEKGEVTLKAIAGVFNIPAVRVYSVAKQPKEGVVYDSHVYNWEAIEKFVSRRLGQEGLPATLEEVIDQALIIDAELREADGRRAANRGYTGKKQIEVDGKMIPERRYSNHEIDANELVVLKKDPEVYKIVYQTRSHTVLVPVSDREGTIKSNMVKVISNFMINQRGMGPIGNAQGIDMRFSGEFAEKFPQYMPGYKEETEETPTAE